MMRDLHKCGFSIEDEWVVGEGGRKGNAFTWTKAFKAEDFLKEQGPVFNALCAFMEGFWCPDEFGEFEDVLHRWEDGLKWLDKEPFWRDGGHAGDCTRACMTCMRCLVESSVEDAWKLLNPDAGQARRQDQCRQEMTSLVDLLADVALFDPHQFAESPANMIREYRKISETARKMLRSLPLTDNPLSDEELTT